MIDRIHINERSSKIVKHNGVVYLTGQVAEGDTIQEQVRVCLQKIETLLDEAGSSKEQMLRGESQARPKYMSVAIVPACIKLAITMPIKMKM